MAGYWLSQPSPSHFGVEALYRDISVGGNPSVVDRITLAPITPGVYFHLYYSNDPTGPGTDSASWDNLLWQPAYKTCQATRTQTFPLRTPIAAKYIKIEFTNLQARPYDPGNFQVPSTFRKFPQWVLNYFLALFQSLDHDFLSTSFDVTYDALDLAFQYYRNDIVQAPDRPSLSEPVANQSAFVQANSTADQADPTTLSKIRTAFQPYTSAPTTMGDPTSLLGRYASAVSTTNYSTETIQTALGNTSIVSNVQREALVVEKGFPVMFFYLPCRHSYRISQAMFEKNIGYFAGVSQLTLHRDVYTNALDQPQYNEILADGANLMFNDFVEFPPTLH